MKETKITITEHRATTDDAIRLAEEYEQKILGRLVSNLNVSNNQITFNLLCFDCPMTQAVKCIVKYQMNEENYSFDFDVKYWDFSRLNGEELFKQCTDKIAKSIAKTIVISSLKALNYKGDEVKGDKSLGQVFKEFRVRA